jgi:hypothetical protein
MVSAQEPCAAELAPTAELSPASTGRAASAASRPVKSKGTPPASPSSPVVYARLRAGPAPPPGMGICAPPPGMGVLGVASIWARDRLATAALATKGFGGGQAKA